MLLDVFEKNIVKDFVDVIDRAESFQHCFDLLTQYAEKLGFDGVLYSYVPFTLNTKPKLVFSENYGNEFVQNYQNNTLSQYDHVVRAAVFGSNSFVNWFDQPTIDTLDDNALMVLETTNKFGIKNGVSFRTFSSPFAYAGVSLICKKDNDYFENYCMQNLAITEQIVQYFYKKISFNNYNRQIFIHPLLPKLNNTKKQILRGFAQGFRPDEIAIKIGKDEKYIKNIASSIYKDFGCTTNMQLMYMLGAMQLYEYID